MGSTSMSDCRIYVVMLFGVQVCVLVGLCSSCIFKYDFIVYMIHSIILCGIMFYYIMLYYIIIITVSNPVAT
jgi:hypothetical protein